MNAISKMTVSLYGASIFRDTEKGISYPKIFIGQQADLTRNTSTQEIKGIEVMQMSCDEAVFSNLDAPSYPCSAELDVVIRRAGGGNIKNHCVGIKPTKPQPANASAKANQ